MKPTLALFALLSTFACQAQQAAKTDNPFTLPAGQIALPDLIDRCASYLGCNILRNPVELQMSSRPDAQATTLQQPITTDKAGCEEMLTTMLWSQGFALVEVDSTNGTREVISLHGPRARDITANAKVCTVEQILARPNLKIAVSTTVPLQHVNAPIVVNSMRPFLASTAGPGLASITLGAAGNVNTILITGMQHQVAQAIELIRKVDVPPPAATGTPPVSMVERLTQKIEELEKRIAALEQQIATQKAK
jgi:hypothetical protein